MKKVAFLTSVLALAACGGGGSGGMAPSAPTTPGQTITPEQRAAESNKTVTSIAYDNSQEIIALAIANGMDSDYVQSAVPAASTSRAATRRNAANVWDTIQAAGKMGVDIAIKFLESKDITVAVERFKLENIEFSGSMQALADNDKNEFVLGTDKDGKITSMTYTEIKDGTPKNSYLLTRQDDESAIFTGKVSDKDQEIDAEFTLTTYGQGVGLSYSDFGRAVPVVAGETADYEMFAGVLKERQIDRADIEQDMTFSGKAVGAVTARAEGMADEALELNGDATVNFNATTDAAKLTANFDNWYTVTVENITVGKLGDPETASATFTNQADGLDSKFVISESGNQKTTSFIQYAGKKDYIADKIDTSETVGWVRHEQQSENGELDMHISFGAIKDNN